MTLYALRPDPESGSLDDAEVVEQSQDGWKFLGEAITLWRLVDQDRANQIDAIKDRVAMAAPDEEARLYTEDLRELVRLLMGVEDAIIAAGIVDSHWRVPVDRLDELVNRVPAMDLTTERALSSKTNALGEVMSNVIFVRNFLESAVNAGCVVVFG